jgi:hypothetical protein
MPPLIAETDDGWSYHRRPSKSGAAVVKRGHISGRKDAIFHSPTRHILPFIKTAAASFAPMLNCAVSLAIGFAPAARVVSKTPPLTEMDPTFVLATYFATNKYHVPVDKVPNVSPVGFMVPAPPVIAHLALWLVVNAAPIEYPF